MASVRRFFIRTYGCQMNAHDTEKVANLLYHQGYVEAGHPDQADLLLINTCSIREKAEHRLYSDLGMLRQWKAAVPGRVLGVGGCVAQQEGDAILRPLRAIWISSSVPTACAWCRRWSRRPAPEHASPAPRHAAPWTASICPSDIPHTQLRPLGGRCSR